MKSKLIMKMIFGKEAKQPVPLKKKTIEPRKKRTAVKKFVGRYEKKAREALLKLRI